MKHLLDLLAAVALLVWGTHLVRSGILRAFGAQLRRVLARGMRSRPAAAAAGLGVTALVQSSTATGLLVSSFAGQGLVALPVALAMMLGADVGSSLLALVLSLDLSWLSPLLIFAGVVLFLGRQTGPHARVGHVLIGLGLMLLALRLIGDAAAVIVHSPAVRTVLLSLNQDLLLAITVGAILTLCACSSLAIVLLTAALATSGALGLEVAAGLVLGANLGSGILGVLATLRSSVEARRVPAGNLLFRTAGVLVAAPLAPLVVELVVTHAASMPYPIRPAAVVVGLHLAFNAGLAALGMAFVPAVARLVHAWMPRADVEMLAGRPHHLEPSALATPSLAISCAAREALHQADVVETMLNGVLRVIDTNDTRLAAQLRKMDDRVDQLYSAIKYYLTRISRESLAPADNRRWNDIISFTIGMEQIGDIIERVLQDVEDKKIAKGRSFSDAGMAEIRELHARLVGNLRLGMSVFLNRSPADAARLLEEKARFSALERAYAGTHLSRLADQTVQSIETSSLHLDLISDFKRINSLICSIAYPVLDANAVQAGAGVAARATPAQPIARTRSA